MALLVSSALQKYILSYIYVKNYHTSDGMTHIVLARIVLVAKIWTDKSAGLVHGTAGIFSLAKIYNFLHLF